MSFKSDNWLIGAERRLLISIALTDPETKRETNYPSNPTLYFTDIPDPSTGNFTYGGTVYSPMVQKFSGNAASIDFRGSASDADATLVLANIRYPFQFKHSVGANESNQYNVKLSQLFADYLWSGATFTATCYCRVGATESTQDVFKGVVYDFSSTVNTVVIRLIQDKSPIRLKPDSEGPGSATYPSVVQKINYASAPDASIGHTLPIVYSGSGWLPTIEGADGLSTKSTNVMNLWSPVGIEARYNGTYTATYAMASYPTQTAPPTTNIKSFVYFSEGDRLAVSVSPTATANVQELLLSLAPSSTFYMYINPTDWVAGATGITDPGKAFDGISTTYAIVAYSGAARTLDLRIPSIGPYGRIVGCSAFLQLAAGGTTVAGVDGSVYGDFGMWNASTAGYHDAVSTNITKANTRDGGFLTANFTSTTYGRPTWQSWQWQEAASGAIQDIYFRVRMSTAGTDCRVVACGLRVEFEPAIPVQGVYSKLTDRDVRREKK